MLCGSRQVQAHIIWLSRFTTSNFCVVRSEVNFNIFLLLLYGLDWCTVISEYRVISNAAACSLAIFLGLVMQVALFPFRYYLEGQTFYQIFAPWKLRLIIHVICYFWFLFSLVTKSNTYTLSNNHCFFFKKTFSAWGLRFMSKQLGPFANVSQSIKFESYPVRYEQIAFISPHLASVWYIKHSLAQQTPDRKRF